VDIKIDKLREPPWTILLQTTPEKWGSGLEVIIEGMGIVKIEDSNVGGQSRI